MQSAPQTNPPNSTAKRRSPTLNLIILALIMGGIYWIINWLSQDITGEYTAFTPPLGVISMSFERRDGNIYSKLGCGSGAYLEANFPDQPNETFTNVVFQLPDKWIRQGQRQRKIIFNGTIKDGTVQGSLRDGQQVQVINLQKDALISLRYVVQSHLPGGGD